MTGDKPQTRCIDHVDTNPFHNAWTNLRSATQSQNLANRGANSTNTSGYKGVTWCKLYRKWVARITVNYKNLNLGYFDNPQEAHAAYCQAATRIFGAFARTG